MAGDGERSKGRGGDGEGECPKGRGGDGDGERSKGRGGDGRFLNDSSAHEGGSSKYRERDRYREKHEDSKRDRVHVRDEHRERDQDRGRYWGRGRGHDRHYRQHRDGSKIRDHRRNSHDSDHHWRRDSERRRDTERIQDGHHRHRSNSRSKSSKRHRSNSHSKSNGRDHRCRSRSRSHSRSRHNSRFDQGPPEQTPLATGRATVAGTAPALAGMLPNTPSISSGQAARRVYVGGLPSTANEQRIAIFFNQVMVAIGGNTPGPGDPVVNVYVNKQRNFAFVGMRSVEEASNAMALDGITFDGVQVNVRRPTDYNPSVAAALGPSWPNPDLNLAAVGLTYGGSSDPNCIFVGGLPSCYTEFEVRRLLETVGPLRTLDLVKHTDTGKSKGHAFCIYDDPAVTDIACATLNGTKIRDKILTVKRANQGATQLRREQESILLLAQQQAQLQVEAIPTKVVCLTHAVTADELKDDQEYEDIMEEMREEAGKYGNLVKVVIPRPAPSGETIAGVGKVFLEYADTMVRLDPKRDSTERSLGATKSPQSSTHRLSFLMENTMHKFYGGSLSRCLLISHRGCYLLIVEGLYLTKCGFLDSDKKDCGRFLGWFQFRKIAWQVKTE